MRSRLGVIATTVLAMVATMLTGINASGASSPNNGVTTKVIRVGIPYIDLSALVSVGVKLNQGSFPDAFNALIDNLNNHGGIDGRHVVPYFATVNPTNTAASLAVCTQMTEDNQIFVAMSPYMPNCYLEDHGTPTILASSQSAASSVPNFTLTPPASAYDPVQLSVFSKMGLFKNKKVGLFAGNTIDKGELQVVQKSLKKLHANVVQTAVDSAPSTDQAASNQQVQIIAQKFQSVGVNEVVAVGTGSSVWPAGLLANQSTYNPNWIATDETELSGSIGGTSSNSPQYLKTVTTSTPTPTSLLAWKDPSIQSCVAIIRKAYPNDAIASPKTTGNSSDHSYVAPEAACQDMAMFTKIAEAAGKHLTVTTFTQAGYGLRHVTFPGSGGPVSFGPGQPYAIGPVYVGKYSTSANQLVFSTKSATS